MADITMCMNKECPLCKQCHRATAKSSGGNQAWANFGSFVLPSGEIGCEYYWPNSKTGGCHEKDS